LNGVTTSAEMQDPVTGGLIQLTINPGWRNGHQFLLCGWFTERSCRHAVHPVRYVNDIEQDWIFNGYEQLFSEEIKLNTDGTTPPSGPRTTPMRWAGLTRPFIPTARQTI